ncbi:MAG TPA: nitroreductase family protein [bacterium]|nr:nitroreductase family protein [bacterium]
MTEDLRVAYAERFGLEPGRVPPLEGGEALLRMLGRSTCRAYRAEPVPEPLLRTLLACAQSAPSKSDLQQYSIVVVEDAAARREIASWLPSMPWVAEAPVFLLFCADMRRDQRVCALRERPHANNNLDTVLNATVDAALALGTFIAAAEAAGLGCCPISYVRNHLPELTAMLGLPPGVFPIAGLCVGWPAARAQVSMRLPPAVAVHRDRYDDGQLPAELAAYDERRCASQPIPPAKQKNADVYGTTDRGTWTDQVSRQLSRPERPGFRAFLLRHGFELA